MAGLLLRGSDLAVLVGSRPANDPLTNNILDRREGPLCRFRNGSRVRAYAWICEFGYPKPGRTPDDDAAHHPGHLVREAEIIVDSLDGQRDREGLIRQEVVRVPRLGPLRDAADVVEVLRVVGRRGVRVAGIAVGPTDRLAGLHEHPDRVEPDLRAVGVALHADLDSISRVADRGGREPARRSPPPIRRKCRRVGILLGRSHARLVGLRHMPEHDVVVRLLDPGVAGIEVHRDVVDLAAGRGEVVELLLSGDVLSRDHVDGADQLAVAVVGQEGAGRERLGINVERAETRQEVGQFHEFADLLVGAAGWGFLDLIGRERWLATSKPMLSIQTASPSRASTGGPRLIGSIPELIKRAFLGWLRGEPGTADGGNPDSGEEDAKRPSRERETLVSERTRLINRMKAVLARLGIRSFKPELRKPHSGSRLVHARGPTDPTDTLDEIRRDLARLAMIRAQIKAIEQAVWSAWSRRQRRPACHGAPPGQHHRCWRGNGGHVGAGDLWRNLRDRRAVARYAGLTGSPDESGSKRREKGLAKSGNARVRRGLIQLAWRFLRFQRDSALAQWYRARTEGAKGARKTTMIVALARKLLIALWRMVTTGEVPARRGAAAGRLIGLAEEATIDGSSTPPALSRGAADNDPRWW